MWTVENRGRYKRDPLRYPSDVTEEEWAEIASLIPPARRGGRKRTVDIRAVFKGLRYVSVARDSERSVTSGYDLGLLGALAGGWDAGTDSHRTLCEVPRATGPGGQSNCLYPR
jgi:hypothetical protein